MSAAEWRELAAAETLDPTGNEAWLLACLVSLVYSYMHPNSRPLTPEDAYFGRPPLPPE